MDLAFLRESAKWVEGAIGDEQEGHEAAGDWVADRCAGFEGVPRLGGVGSVRLPTPLKRGTPAKAAALSYRPSPVPLSVRVSIGGTSFGLGAFGG